MAAALLAARLHYGVFGDGGGNRYVLMATDGVPGCTLSGTLSDGSASTSPPCVDATYEIEALVQSGVKVIVLSLGKNPATSEDADDCLEALAQAGGAPQSKDGLGYYSAADPSELALAIERIFGVLATPSCVLSVPPGSDKSRVSVFLDGQEIPYSATAGWTWSAPGSWDIEINGAYCREIQQFQVSGFEARYACPASCIDRGECPSDPLAGPPPS